MTHCQSPEFPHVGPCSAGDAGWQSPKLSNQRVTCQSRRLHAYRSWFICELKGNNVNFIFLVWTKSTEFYDFESNFFPSLCKKNKTKQECSMQHVTSSQHSLSFCLPDEILIWHLGFIKKKLYSSHTPCFLPLNSSSWKVNAFSYTSRDPQLMKEI